MDSYVYSKSSKMESQSKNSRIHTRAKILVGVEWILGLTGTTVILIALMFHLTGPNVEVAPLLTYRPYVLGDSNRVDVSPEAIKKAAIYVAVLSTSVIVSSTIPVSLSILLAMGITQKSIVKCKLWMALHVIVFFGCLGIFFAEMFKGMRFHYSIYATVGIIVFLRLIVMKAMVDFIHTIKEEGRQRFRELHIPKFRVLEKI